MLFLFNIKNILKKYYLIKYKSVFLIIISIFIKNIFDLFTKIFKKIIKIYFKYIIFINIFS